MAIKSQIENRNFLSPVGFKFVLQRTPKVSFFANTANIPSISMGNAVQTTYLKDIPVPGDKIDYGDFTLRFIVDENLENYMQIHKWIRGLGYPESLKEIFDLQNEEEAGRPKKETIGMNIYSDGTLQVLNSSYNSQFNVVFKDMFPVELSALDFDATNNDIEYFTADVTFKYTIYNIEDTQGNRL